METHNMERKESWSSEWLKTICGFANTEGGVLIIGIKDKGKVIGVKDPHDLMKVIPDTVRNKLDATVFVRTITMEDKICIEITVEKGGSYTDLDGVFYKRVGNTTQRVTGKELESWILSNMKVSWTDLPSKGNIDSVSEEAVKHFVDSGKSADRLPKDLGYDKRTRSLKSSISLIRAEH